MHQSTEEEEFDDNKEVIRIRKPKNRQDNGERKKDKGTNNDQQNIHINIDRGTRNQL
jgi:hypothetical protein